MVDIAAEPARRDDDPDLCAPTGHGGARVDQSWANHAVAPAVQRYATFGTVRWTDHHGVVCRTDTDAIDRSEIMVWA
ncbi:hypothetical protein [Thermomonospora umbrina]|uniref:hypothetical protein n=1 Tax=Thermomonospora umbrina TaxID=111806 RepID=UPI0011C12850|nr:hypothetical protein [Thermomonospora umbrina]